MRTFNTVQINVDGTSVPVDTAEILNPSGAPSIKVTATVGTTVVEMSHTFLPVESSFSVLNPAHVQTGIDNIRMRAARKALMLSQARTQLDAAT
jgi:hypothetical protein